MKEARPAVDGSSFSPIEDYALIGDARSAALVSKKGSIDWLCWPRFDSPAIFAALLDPDRGGRCQIQPTSEFRATRRYSKSSNVLITTFETRTGTASVTDLFFATSEGTKGHRLLPQAMIIRRLECLDGAVEFDFEVEPRTDFGKRAPGLQRRGAGSWMFSTRDGAFHVASEAPLEVSGGRIGATVPVSAGQAVSLILAYNGNEPAVFPPLTEVPRLIEETDAYWKTWAGKLNYEGPHREEVVRSALVLKLLTYAPSGAIVAAPTSSLPERLGASYNWDYRFCWLRDASDTVEALFDLSMEAEGRAFLQWLLHATRLTAPKVQVMYSVLGNPALPEKELRHLSGYRNSRPVRVGNSAHRQLQLDAQGEVIRAASVAVSRGLRLSGDEKTFLRGLAHYALDHWHLPDSGIWETRGAPRHFVHSKVMCWVALDRIAQLAEAGHIKVDIAKVRAAASTIERTVKERGYNESLGTYTAALDSTELDAAVLTLPLLGFEDARSPAMASTIDVLRKRLSRNGLLLRHENDETGGEGTFLMCSFWLVECLLLQEKRAEATELFTRLCGFANDVGLFSEEIDAESGAFLGNFPQAFTHIGLINAALALEEPGNARTAEPAA